MLISVFEKAAKATFAQMVSQLAQKVGIPSDMLNAALPASEAGAYGTYGWLSDLPTMKKFLGERKAKELVSSKYQIFNEEYYDSINVKTRDIELDQVGAYLLRIRDLVLRMYQGQRKLISDLLVNGTSGKAFDDIAFFSNATGSRVNDNYLSGVGVDTLAHIQADVEAVIATMAAFVDSEGEPLNIVPDTIWCNPLHVFKMKKVVGSSSDPSQANPGVDNALRDYSFTVVGNPKITGNSWMSGCTKGILKPFIIQERKSFQDVVDDTFAKAKKIVQYSVDWDGGVGYGLPCLACYVYNP